MNWKEKYEKKKTVSSYAKKITVMIACCGLMICCFTGCDSLKEIMEDIETSYGLEVEEEKTQPETENETSAQETNKNTITYVTHSEEYYEASDNGYDYVYDYEIKYDEASGMYINSAYNEETGDGKILKYDSKGNLIEEQDGTGSYVKKYIDENGSCDIWKGEFIWGHYLFDEDGKTIVGYCEYSQDGCIFTQYDFYYDQNGNKMGSVSIDGSYEYEQPDYEYDNEGRIIRISYEDYEELYEYDDAGNLCREKYTTYSNGEVEYTTLTEYSTMEIPAAQSITEENGYASFDNAISAFMELHCTRNIDQMTALFPENLTDAWLEILGISGENPKESYKMMLEDYFSKVNAVTEAEYREYLMKLYEKNLEGETLQNALSDTAMNEAVKQLENRLKVYCYLCPSSDDVYHKGLGEAYEYDGYEMMATAFYSFIAEGDVGVAVLNPVGTDLYYPVLKLDY